MSTANGNSKQSPAVDASPVPMAPSAPEAEEAVLGSVLISPDLLDELAAILRPDDFFGLRNNWLWVAFFALRKRGDVIDILTVGQELRNQGRYDDVGGTAYLTYLIGNTPTHIHAEVYARMVERTALRRRLLNSAQKIGQAALDDSMEIEDLINVAASSVSDAVEQRSVRKFVNLSSAAHDYYDELSQGVKQDRGLSTGFSTYDRLLGGLQPGTLNLVAARTSVGKTIFLFNIATFVSGVAAYFSMEMNLTQMTQRFVSTLTGVNTVAMRSAKLSEREWGLFTDGLPDLKRKSIWLDDTPKITPGLLRAKCLQLKRDQRRLDLIVVDYVQLMAPDKSEGSRYIDVGSIAVELKNIAREFDVPVLAAAQMNRASESTEDKEPQLWHLGESTGLENSADTVLMLARANGSQQQVKAWLRKHRNGPLGFFLLNLKAERSRFIEES